MITSCNVLEKLESSVQLLSLIVVVIYLGFIVVVATQASAARTVFSQWAPNHSSPM